MPDNTTVRTIDIESLDDLFPGVATDSVIVPEAVKKSVLSTDEPVNLDPKNLEKPIAPVVVPAAGETAVATEVKPAGDENVSFDDLVETNEEANKVAGRAKTDKSGIVELYKKKIDAGVMVPFDDYKEGDNIEEYLGKLSMKDLEDLWDANETRKVQEVEQKVPQQFFNSLPQELQFAAKYVADGGTDMRGLFKALAQVEEVRQLDPEKNPREVAYQYLKATNYGDDAEIKEQLDEWEDVGTINKKALGFKPKLDKMQSEIVQTQLDQQAEQKVQRDQAAARYVQNVQDSLKQPEIAGIKLDKKTHDFLTQGLLQPAFPSITGKPTNLLGHLLEKYQVVEPNYQLVAEAMWLLADPDGYRNKLIERGKNENTAATVRQLKTEATRKQSSSQYDEDATGGGQKRTPKTVQRPGAAMFKR
ncbi:MAG TPA: hypothetical protein VGM30_10620 [Puia sp.]|jgi:hypothetical protein